jgi:hypothetical protein
MRAVKGVSAGQCYTSRVKAKNMPKNRPAVPNPAGKRGLPVSLYPLSFTDAVAGLAQVKMPEPDSKKPRANPKKGK